MELYLPENGVCVYGHIFCYTQLNQLVVECTLHRELLIGTGPVLKRFISFISAYDIGIPDGVSDVNLQHTYDAPGLYKAKVSVFNKISLETITASVGILEDISDVNLEAYTRKWR